MNTIITSCIAIMLLASCGSSSKITSTWKAPDVQPGTYDKIMVVGLIADPDRSIREKMEEHLVGDLRNLGYNAVAASSEFGPKAFEGIKENEALQMLKDKGIEAVMTIILLDKTKERYYVPGNIYYSPYGIYQRYWYPYYSTMYGRIYSPGYYATDTKYFWESNFYSFSAGTTTLLYSAQSQSFDPSSVSTLGHEYGLAIINDMVSSNVLKSNQKK
ncbi:hypothetical protein KJS94_05250 [Flavihumibacter rivuli]|uniref:hypothetical protein n=1 Tax=Flavihumibacter rivuli TaxID=2838156 RepID=UPI001BDE3147|nr:hypothetical protein [Flavihumibacter rivuli]ULQ57605.1 hypothetical protein KJS94_05250 [Flavihumibacter rivuli]